MTDKTVDCQKTEVITYNLEEAIDYIDEKIREIQDYPESETKPERIEKLNKLMKLCNELRVEVEDRAIYKIQIEIKSVNYGKLWREYYDAVISEDKIRINKAYRQLIAGIRAANTLEIVEPLQRLYLYVLSIGVWPHLEELGETILGGRFKVREIAEEIRKRLENLKTEIIEKIEAALKDESAPQEKELLTRAKKEINEIDFTEPLRAFRGKKERKFFICNEVLAETDKILGKVMV